MWEEDTATTKLCVGNKIYYAPSIDTFYFPDMPDFCEVFWPYKLNEGGIPGPDVRLGDIRSIAIGECIQRAYFATSRGRIELWHERGLGLWVLDSALADCFGLEELVLVVPGVQELSSLVNEIVTIANQGVKRSLSPDPVGMEKRLQEFLKLFEADLKEKSERKIRYWDQESMKKYGRTFPIAVWKWWKNPVVKLITQEEFRAQF